MSRAGSPDEDLEIAKEHLDFPNAVKDEAVLQVYVEELRKLRDEYEHDTNFRITLQPRFGFGIIKCLEDGCKRETIYLGGRDAALDGGREIGFGSLLAYRVHISKHAKHRLSRNARVYHTRESPVRTGPRNQASSLASGYRKAVPQSSSPKLSTPAQPNLRTAPLSPPHPYGTHPPRLEMPIKLEPENAPVPRKRRSSVALNTLKSEENLYSSTADFAPPLAKIAKLEPDATDQMPLSASNRPKPLPFPLIKKSDSDDADRLEDRREQLDNVRHELMDVRRKLTKAEIKRGKTKGDQTRIARLRAQVATLRGSLDAVNALGPSLPVVHHVTGRAEVPPPPPFHNLAFGDQHYNQNITHDVAATRYSQSHASGSHIKSEPDPDSSEDEDEALRDLQFSHNILSGMYGRAERAKDIDDFLVEAGNAAFFDENANVQAALEKLGLPDLFHPLPGMEVALMPHQAIGLAWMVEKERSMTQGGILADDMGLGKTVQMIALMVKNRPLQATQRSCLIVAPLALLDQWQLEIETKTTVGLDLRCLVYHGTGKVKTLEQLQQYDIVLTTFQTLASELLDDETEDKKRKQRKSDANAFIIDDAAEEGHIRKRKSRKVSGLLYDMNWYRVILDEAQNIRNRRTRSSRAVAKLRAVYRWCLTGTPIINSLTDAYGLLRFLKVRPWYEWEEFNAHVAIYEKKKPSLATARLQAIFASVLLRRKKDSLLDGKPLVELPLKTVELCKLEFSQEERDIYMMLEMKSQAIFNRYLRAGTVLKNYYQVLVLLLRLRQVCSHPSLIQENGLAYIRPGEEADTSNRNAELLRAAQLIGAAFVDRERTKRKEIALARMSAEKESVLEGEDLECAICQDNFTNPVIAICGHEFCKSCITERIRNMSQAQDNDNDTVNSGPRCPVCNVTINEHALFSREAFEPTEAELMPEEPPMVFPTRGSSSDGTEGLSSKSRRSSRKRKSVRRVIDSDDDADFVDEDEDDLSDFIVYSDEDVEEKDARRETKKRLSKGKRSARQIVVDSDDEYGEDIIHGAKPDFVATPEQIALMPRFLPSTKMKAMMEFLRKWAQEHPDEKVLVISQWTQCLQLVSDFLTENGFLHVKYQGDMNRNKRDLAVRVFMAKDKASVMLMSLKCGGVGLNLTRANRVISLDLGWSLAVEQQAYDRVHRLGQHRPVHVQRLVIANTVEDRILALQERKKNLADGSLGEGGGAKLKLSVRELANLFGLDHRGERL